MPHQVAKVHTEIDEKTIKNHYSIQKNTYSNISIIQKEFTHPRNRRGTWERLRYHLRGL